MFRSIGRAVTIFALCCAIGLHWIALQSLAWTTMIVKYSKELSLPAAIAQTFDGSHPCSLCHAVSKGKSSEKKPEAQFSSLKIDMICSIRTVRLSLPLIPFNYKTNSFGFPDGGQSPLVPPPRARWA